MMANGHASESAPLDLGGYVYGVDSPSRSKQAIHFDDEGAISEGRRLRA